MSKEIICLNCGKCCTYIIDRKPTEIPCKHLKRLEDGTTRCKFYHQRINKSIGHGNRCNMRKDSTFDYEGCPYNTNKPIAGKDIEFY